MSQVLAHSGCAEVFAKVAELDRKAEVASADYQRQHPNASTFDLVDEVLKQPAPALSDEESLMLQGCRRAFDFMPAVIFVALALALWSVAFVLAGRFWLPPAQSR
jgi:hypothetical protein